MRTNLIITTRFGALHNWETIPSMHSQYYLKYPHRHVFQITLKFPVDPADDRVFEFIEAKNIFDHWLRDTFVATSAAPMTPHIGDMSCERFAAHIHDNFCLKGVGPTYIRIMEDGENGAEVIYD